MTKILGECVSGDAQAQVTISHLAPFGCRCLLHASTHLDDSDLDDRELSLWIGAIGPLPIVASHDGSNEFTARFKQPLEAAIIAHFNA